MEYRIEENKEGEYSHTVIGTYEGEGDDQRIQINFGRQGMKWLMLSLAKLERG